MRTGFVDLQVNGFLGIDFSSSALKAEDISAVTLALQARGTAAYCPTIVTAPEAIYERNLPMLAYAIETGSHAILGIHLEGPFISPLSKGAHPEEHIRSIDCATFDRWQRLARGRIRLVTVAPELPGAEEFIRHLYSNGVAVSLGHHLADGGAIHRAVAAGAASVTHLGNGLPLDLPRHPNPIWSQLAEDELFAMCICDGHHLPPEVVKVVVRAKTPGRFVVVSDAAPIAGLSPGRYRCFGTEIVMEASGRIAMASNQGLAGSSSSMLDCMNWLAGLGILDEADLWRVGVENPLAVIGEHAGFLPRLNSFVLFRDGRFEVVKTNDEY